MKRNCVLPLKAMAFTALLAWGSMGIASAQRHEFAQFDRYAKANAELPAPVKGEKRVVFMGNSITDIWAAKHPDFFKQHGYVGRGISGQTSYQFLLRFRQDVIDLKPKLVVINYGTNDIAETQAPTTKIKRLTMFVQWLIWRVPIILR